jgi:hypothetical protein
MRIGQSHRRRLGGGALFLTLLTLLGPGAGSAAALAPAIGEVWASDVFGSSARFWAQINPNGLASGYHVDYIAKSAYDANVSGGKDPFSGAARAPLASDATVPGSGTLPVDVNRLVSSLSLDTAYRYRFVAKNSTGTTTGPAFTIVTRDPGGPLLPDSRGWEMVSPVDKNGGEVARPGTIAAGGVAQAAAAGGSITYGSSTSFGSGAAGAAAASQYVASRAAGGWETENITAPLYSGSYGAESEGVPYQLFSGDLARALLLNGRRCRGEGTSCAVPNPPPAGTDAPAGYQNYYLREGPAYMALLGAANAGLLTLEPSEFELRLAGATPDLRRGVLSTCAALTASATEAPLGGGCDPAQPNLYEYLPGAGLSLVNLLPAQSVGAPGAALGAQSAAVSNDGSRVYWSQLASGNLYLREGAATKQVDTAAGGGGSFETASADGATAFFSKAGHLWRYQAAGAGSATDLTPSGGVQGVLGASEDGAHVYYLTASGLFHWHSGTTTKVADAADASNYPPTTGAARVSADGTRALFIATAPLTGYDNEDLNTHALDSQVYLYDATGAGTLTCVSCNPTLQRPTGPSTIPGAIANGDAPGSIAAYKPRVLAAGGRRVFFESLDEVGLQDTNDEIDVYQWEAQGTGGCTRSGGCVGLISSGKAGGGASFVDASANGDDAFFLTDGPLILADPGATDLYDARVGGGFAVPSPPIVCNGDACQPLPSQPVDPTLNTQQPGPGNPGVSYTRIVKRCKKGYVKRKGKCVKKKANSRKKADKRRRAGSRR